MCELILTAALQYHSEGLCVIPCKPRNKMPALHAWEEYQTRRSEYDEVRRWFEKGECNVGVVHGPVSNNYVTLDFDHDAGLFDIMRTKFPALFTGRLEQSGSMEGFHLPLFVDNLPDFGYAEKQGRPRGNKNWKTKTGECNVRVSSCQTIAPPSIHPTGNRYRFIQEGDIIRTESLDPVVEWLNKLAPPPPPKRLKATINNRTPNNNNGSNLVESVKSAWTSALDVFRHFGMANDVRADRGGELRLKGNGGLLIRGDDPTLWYNFSDEVGGDLIDAWGYCRFGSAYDRDKHFRDTLIEMAGVAGLDVARHWRRGDERITGQIEKEGDRWLWTKQYDGRWGLLR